jgi:FAD/FMN-containing dehydrogenase
MTTMSTSTQLREHLRGRVVDRDDPDYDEVRSLYNAMIDKHPLLIGQCRDAADVVACVEFARAEGLRVAVRGGGHNGPGLSSIEDGLMIDLSQMKGVRVDPETRTVRVGPGCTSGDVDHATHAYGLAVPFGIVSTTGVAGLTLGGGMGYLSRQHGLTIDNLLEADVVLADGSLVTASPTHHADLFWGLRGGGGNFGIVTSFLFRAHPVSTVFAGPVFWDAEHTAEVMRAYRDFLAGAPDRLGSFVGIKKVPDVEIFPAEHRGKLACAVISCFNGPADEGAEAMRPLLDALPEPMFNWMGEMPYPAIQMLFDPLMVKGMQWYWRGEYVHELTDAMIQTHIEQTRDLPGTLSLMHLYPINGAVHNVGSGETAWHERSATWTMVIAAIDPDPAVGPQLSQWAKRYWSAIHEHTGDGGGYVNFMHGDGDAARLAATYGENYDRLTALKQKYDPENFFHENQNIPPHGPE